MDFITLLRQFLGSYGTGLAQVIGCHGTGNVVEFIRKTNHAANSSFSWSAILSAAAWASGASTMTRASGSVPEGRTSSRPVPAISVACLSIKAWTSGRSKRDLSGNGILTRACGNRLTSLHQAARSLSELFI